MRYLFYLGHPAHFHLFRNVIERLRRLDHEVLVVIKKKDILEELLQRAGWPYRNIQKRGRGDGKIRIALGLLARDWRMLRMAREFRPHLMLGTSAEVTHVGRVLGIPSMVVNEDDHDVVPLFSHLAYPFATHVLAPETCRVGRWSHKTIAYPGFHELAYLHPNQFIPDPSIRADLGAGDTPYFLLRFAKLNAHHDAGRFGIRTEVAAHIVHMLEPHGRVFITAERELEPEFERYRVRIDPLRMHDVLAFALMQIGDSQTMAAEAAVLGTPSLRFNDFVGEIGYLEALEHRYGLTYGIRSSEPERLFAKIGELLAVHDLKDQWAKRRWRMLEESVDLTPFMAWLLEQYPESVAALRRDRTVLRSFVPSKWGSSLT